MTYALITLPTIVIPPMYGISLLYAIAFGIVAWLVYHLFFALAKSLQTIAEVKWLVLIGSTPLCIAIAYTSIELLHFEQDVWTSEFILFPIVAVISSWIGLYKTRQQINETFNPITKDFLIY